MEKGMFKDKIDKQAVNLHVDLYLVINFPHIGEKCIYTNIIQRLHSISQLDYIHIV